MSQAQTCDCMVNQRNNNCFFVGAFLQPSKGNRVNAMVTVLLNGRRTGIVARLGLHIPQLDCTIALNDVATQCGAALRCNYAF